MVFTRTLLRSVKALRSVPRSPILSISGFHPPISHLPLALSSPPIIGSLDHRRHFATKKKWKGKRKAGKEENEDEEEEEEDEEEEESDSEKEEEGEEERKGMPTDCKSPEFTLLSRRLNRVVARVLGASAVSIEKEIAKGSVRVNGQVILKKAHEVKSGDELEVYQRAYEDNAKLARVHRVHIVFCLFDKKVGYQFNVKWWRNYITDNWKQTAEGKKSAQQQQQGSGE